MLFGCGRVSLCCPLSFRPAQNRSYDAPWFLLFAGRVGTTFSFELLHAATSLNSFLEALPQVVTRAAVLLWLDDAVLISGHTLFRNAKARRPAIRHILHSKGRESSHQASKALLIDDLKNYAFPELCRSSVQNCTHCLGVASSFADYLANILFGGSEFDDRSIFSSDFTHLYLIRMFNQRLRHYFN